MILLMIKMTNNNKFNHYRINSNKKQKIYNNSTLLKINNINRKCNQLCKKIMLLLMITIQNNNKYNHNQINRNKKQKIFKRTILKMINNNKKYIQSTNKDNF